MERKGFLINKAFYKYLWASILTVATSQIANIVDASLVGNIIGAEGLAAVVTSKPVLQAIYAISCLYVTSCTVITGIALGKGDREKANSLFSFSMTVSIVLGIAIALVGLLCKEPLLDILCSSQELRPMAKSFMTVTILSALPQLLMYTMQQFVTIDGSPKIVSRAVIAGNLVNLGMDIVFMKYLGMGIAGAAWATFLMYIVCTLMLLPHFRKVSANGQTVEKLRLCFGKFKEHISGKQLTTLGMPMFLSTALLSVQYTCYNYIATTYLGDFGLISFAVCLQLFSFSMIILTGILRTIQPIGAILKGIGDSRGIYLLLVKAYKFMVFGLIVYTLLIVVFPEQIAAFLGVTNPAAMPTIRQALPAFSLNIIMQTLLCNLMPTYQFYGHNRMALFLSVGQTVLPIFGFWGMAVWLGQTQGIPNAWFGFFLGQLLTAIILLASGEVERHKHTAANVSVNANQSSSLHPITLIPRGEDCPYLDFSYGYSQEAMHKAFDEISVWLKQQRLPDNIVFKVRVIAEELMSNITRHSEQKDKNAYADVRLIVHPDTIIFSLTDNGIPFNPIENKDKGYGLMIANGAASDIQYKYQFCQNMTTVKVGINE